MICFKSYGMFGNFLFMLMYFMAVLSRSLWPDRVYPPFYFVIVWSIFGSLMFLTPWLFEVLIMVTTWSLAFGLWHCAFWWIGAKLHGITSQKMEGSVCIIFNFSMGTDIFVCSGSWIKETWLDLEKRLWYNNNEIDA